MIMTRPSPLVWLAIVLLLLLPTAAGRLLLDLAGGLLLILLVLPFLLTGLGWIGWKILQSRMVTCSACGAVNFGGSSVCSVCGTALDGMSGTDPSVPASAVTIDVTAQDAGSDS